jgi:fructose-bisphosphate aldolase class I
MNKEILTKTAARLLAEPKGILAIDESISICNKRFEALGVPTTEEKRREYRELLITAPETEGYLSGFILFDETIRQSTKDGKSFTSILKEKGIEIGIKVDTGTEDFPLHPNEKITTGLDGLHDRLAEYKKMGASFTKWRSVITISDDTPTEADLIANADALGRYALACQEAGLVPIVEPEVLIDGDHTAGKCYEVTAHNLDILFAELTDLDVYMPGVVLKTSMVIPGKDSGEKITDEEVTELTLKCLREHVPEDIGGIVFLSGGMKDEEATTRLNAMKKMGPLPWPLTFSYGRAIQNEALMHWAKHPADISGAQKKLLEKARVNSLASVGKYK